jgi:hypothetical protein
VVTLEAINWYRYGSYDEAAALFYEWAGDLTGKENPTTITMDGNKYVEAHFLAAYKIQTPTPTSRRATLTPTATPTPTSRPSSTPVPTGNGGYVVAYNIQSDWGNGATVNVTIKNNNATPVNGWTLAFTFPGNRTITNLWNGTCTQSGAAVSVKDGGFNASIPANGGSVNFGFNLNYSGTNAKPAGFTLNGVSCQVQ